MTVLHRLKGYIWPAIGLLAVVWATRLLYFKLKAEAASTPAISAKLETGSLFSNLATIASVIGSKIAAIAPEAMAMAVVSAMVAYLALAWYDKLALMHLERDDRMSFAYLGITAFVTYAVAHNIGASVLSGGAVRYRAYTAKGLTGPEVAVLVALCTMTFMYATAMMMGLALIAAPDLLQPLHEFSPWFAIPPLMARVVGLALIAGCIAYMIGSLLSLKSITVKGVVIAYPRPRIVALQTIIAPIEILGAAGIIYFVLPAENHPGFMLVLGAFLLSFTAALISQVPGGVGVMEAVFLALMPEVPPSAVFAALLVWRLFYLLIPLVVAIPVVLLFERGRLKAANDWPT